MLTKSPTNHHFFLTVINRTVIYFVNLDIFSPDAILAFSQTLTAIATVFSVCVSDIAFVIDNSGSIRDSDPPGGDNWQLVKDFVKSIVGMFDIGPQATRVAVVDFGKPC